MWAFNEIQFKENKMNTAHIKRLNDLYILRRLMRDIEQATEPRKGVEYNFHVGCFKKANSLILKIEDHIRDLEYNCLMKKYETQ